MRSLFLNLSLRASEKPRLHPSDFPCFFLATIKWPLALISPLLLPFAVLELWRSEILLTIVSSHQAFLLGSVAYLLSWLLIFRRDFSGAYFSTFEHELTHAIFAWMTMHKVTGLSVTWRDGGECRYEGRGNWLITIAPYFFPTLLLVPLLLRTILDSSYIPLTEFVFGFLCVYHLTSTWRETHPAQTDLVKVKYLFAWLFLPTANVMIYGFFSLVLIADIGVGWQFVSNIWHSGLLWLLDTWPNIF
ncbi:MAG: hypothetical protein CL580_05920 [Alteromonadaceae bacterium]|nr:hypothetical protein [Alteromonadaceae bacterium]